MCNLEGGLPIDWSASFREEKAIFHGMERRISSSEFLLFLVGKTVRLTHGTHPHLAVDEGAAGGQSLAIDLQQG
jgi:hypothetical protein